MGGNQFTYGIEGTAGGRGWSIAGGFLKVEVQIVWVQTWIVGQNSAGYLYSKLQHRPLWQFYLGGKCYS
jgi:hypothetical protein